MLTYEEFLPQVELPTGSVTDDFLLKDVAPYLVDLWFADYRAGAPSDDIVETSVGGFDYLFDIQYERLIAAWGISRGRQGHDRDAGRMAGFPLGAGPGYHRGHAIPHRLGGLLDLNLVPQLGRINIGAFRHLEREAVKMPGALYFTYWQYDGDGQTPSGCDQGLLYPGSPTLIRRHQN